MPFRRFVDAGLSGILTAHLLVPALDTKQAPTSLSPTSVTTLLRDRMQFNGLMNRRPSKDSFNYSIDHGRLAIVFWPQNTTVEEMQRVMEYGFDRLDFMYRNLERLDLEG